MMSASPGFIRTPDQRLRVFVSSTMEELAAERSAVLEAIRGLKLTPVLFELGARPHPPRDLYRAYLQQSHVFVGVYGAQYGWVAPGMGVSGLEDEYLLAENHPKLIYVKHPVADRDERLKGLLQRIEQHDRASYKTFASAVELGTLVADDLAVLLSERFEDSRGPQPAAAGRSPPGHARRRRRGMALVIVALVVAIGMGSWLGRRALLPGAETVAAGTGRDDAALAGSMSIAVLPFVNMSPDPEQEYFTDGISEDMLNLLAKIPGLKVAARTSSFSFKGKEIGISEIARQLGVAYVLEGSVRTARGQVRITARLVEAASARQLWSQSYDRELDNIFAIQDEIASDVVTALHVRLLGAAPRARATDPDAYAFYLQAVQLGRQSVGGAFEASNALYRRVLAIDPHYAPAWIGLARNSINEAGLGLRSVAEAYPQARELAMKALEADPESALAHDTFGWIAMQENDLIGASRHFERALALDPANLSVLGNAASLLQTLGRLDESLVLLEAVVHRDPVNVSALYNLAIAQRWAGRLDDAIGTYGTVLSLSPGRGGGHYGRALVLLLQGDADAALADVAQETIELWRMVALPMIYHALGRKADSDNALAALIDRYQQDCSYNIAAVHAFRGEADRAFQWLDKAIEYQDPGLSEIVVDDDFANIHSDRRWSPFLRKLGRAPEQLALIEFDVAIPASQQP